MAKQGDDWNWHLAPRWRFRESLYRALSMPRSGSRWLAEPHRCSDTERWSRVWVHSHPEHQLQVRFRLLTARQQTIHRTHCRYPRILQNSSDPFRQGGLSRPRKQQATRKALTIPRKRCPVKVIFEVDGRYSSALDGVHFSISETVEFSDGGFAVSSDGRGWTVFLSGASPDVFFAQATRDSIIKGLRNCLLPDDAEETGEEIDWIPLVSELRKTGESIGKADLDSLPVSFVVSDRLSNLLG